jgi:hypothetical protein
MKKVLLGFLYAISISASATTYYVSTSGSDTNNGLTMSTPWKTLAYAESKAIDPGDIIALKRGDSFYLTGKLHINQVGSESDHIIWDGGLWGTGAKATITAASGLIYVFALNQCSHLTFQNIIFNGQNRENCAIVIGGPYYNQNGEHDIIVQDCEFYDFGASDSIYAILVETWNNDISNITIRRNIIDGVGQAGIGFYCGRSNMGATPAFENDIYIGYNTITNFSRDPAGTGEAIVINSGVHGGIIEHNTISAGPESNTGYGIIYASGEPRTGYFPENIITRYNDIRTLERPAIYIQQGQAVSLDFYYNKIYQSSSADENGVVRIENDGDPWTGAKIEFHNNVVVSSSGSSVCFYIWTGSTPNVVNLKNNIFINTALSGSSLLFVHKASPCLHSNNCYYRPGTSDLLYVNIYNSTQYLRSNASNWESSGIFKDPLLANLSGFDWRIVSGSPVIGKGIFIPGISLDFEGKALNNPPDIGCFAFSTTGNLAPSVTITSPSKSSSFDSPADISINASASDPDGTITKVEFFNGTSKIGESTVSPYLFVWKNVSEGIYSITAVATDNRNATSVSSEVVVVVSVITALEPGPSGENTNKESLVLYPNPNTGRFSVYLPDCGLGKNMLVTIFNLSGKIIFKELLPVGETVKQFDVTHFPSGIYVVRVDGSLISASKTFYKN